MKLSRFIRRIAFAALLAFTLSNVTLCSAHEVAAEMVTAATKLIGSLKPEQKEKALFDFAGEPRTYWNFIPAEMLKGGTRRGLTLKDMDATQRELTRKLLQTALSEAGHSKVDIIMSLEKILHELEGSKRRFVRDSEMYHVLIFGKPDAKGAWGWRFEGHHLSLNFTIVEGKTLIATPSFMGSNPAQVLSGDKKGLWALKNEEVLARKLVQSLSAAQRKSALIEGKTPEDILTASQPEVKALEAAGVAFADLNKTQQELLTQLIKEYTGRNRAVVAQEDWAKIQKAGLDKIRIAWSGGTEPFQQHYYRVQGPTFLLEYANSQNNANHVHASWRDFNGDFGRDLLREHHSKAHRNESGPKPTAAP